MVQEVLDTASGLVPQAPALRIDEAALRRYLAATVSDFPPDADRLEVFQFSHGQSNPTYLVKAGSASYVLRKKPPGRVLPSAHAVEREFRVLAALQATPVPVPRVLCLCEDASVLGTPFYVMEHVRGRIFTEPSLPGMAPAQRTAAMARTLAALHSVQPGQVGLQGYGKPSGYNRRQVWRWGQQYSQSVAQGQAPMPEMQQLHSWLEANVPPTDDQPAGTRVSHGDFRLDNLVFDSADPSRVLAVLDWELSTLGDPLADLAYNCLPYHLPAASWPFYLALSIFRLAAILAGVGARAAQGNASSRIAAQVGADSVVRSLACKGLQIAGVLHKQGSSSSSLTSSGGSHLMGTPAEPYANPTHPSALPDDSPNILAGNPLEEYANPSPQWRQAAGAAAAALEEADRVLPARVAPTSSRGSSSSSSSSSSRGVRQQPTAAGSPAATAAAAAGVATTGLGPSPRVQPLLRRLQRFMRDHVYPAEAALNGHAMSDQRWIIHPVQERLKAEAKRQGLWNLWLPADMAAALEPLVRQAAASGDEQRLLLGPGLTNLEYAHCAEVMGRSVWAPECFNCSAPDTGNMEVLARYGSREQQRAWLLPLLRGDMRSCFAMTEPAVASSDATNITSSISRQGDSYVLSGRKWWASGASDPRCKVAIFMGKTDPQAPTHQQQSMVLVPMDSPGVTIVRPLPVFGFDDAPHGHSEIVFDGVQVPAANMILGEGRGFEIAQGRLGPGRLHHCMRLVGMGERALELMVQRSEERTAFRQKLWRHQSVRLDIARSRIELDAARLVVLQAAHSLDRVGNKAARGQIAAAKALAPSTVVAIIDRAIQVHGAAGVSDVTPLAHMFAGARTLRLADGPDVVHLETIAKLELAGARQARL
ncbi:hypothetical protein CHLNCDRAFT_138837 [Chlorella variabilis]|uniref:Aminoglycoside phosphotransferase domain-containing protein n=1 Tax=Chlorella variabilis TaxID=554065 RepID=E1ZP55_CHLVA|nr:hypothetical protein CHLNCDRAFT_138837 [Chlorella variabilis]EFN52386.1 hypothetical protein CHLNCDRAFT_138837 [Chlorella variabilis]|eukprot:XP_005844488.1 hypothetical protein CHLNCDRAFT_138837 [Chlorella variabilis]